jgi:hypothetical protein
LRAKSVKPIAASSANCGEYFWANAAARF